MRKAILSSIFLLAAVTMFAQGVEKNGIWYMLYDNMTAKVTYKGWSSSDAKEYSGDIVVPSSVSIDEQDYSVVGIYDGAFAGNDGLTSITLPESIINIGWGAFENCTGLTSLFLPNSLEKISAEAFSGCTGLKTITFGTGLTDVYYKAFMNCSAIESITCKAQIPPTLMLGMRSPTEEDPDPAPYTVFENVDVSKIPVFVPAERITYYYRNSEWNKFKFIKAFDAKIVVVDKVKVEPTENSVVISWPKIVDAAYYLIEIKDGAELICSLAFDANGQLMAVKYAAPSRNRGDSRAPAAVQTDEGWQYTFDGLNKDTDYSYSIKAKKIDNSETEIQSGSFKTKATSTALDEAENDKAEGTKLLRNGRLLIHCNGTVYDITGTRIE